METIISDFLFFMKQNNNISKNTIESYEIDLKRYIKYLVDSEMKLEDVSKTTILSYLSFLKLKNLSESTLARNLSSIRSFYHYLLDKDLVKKDPTYNLKLPKLEKKEKLYLTVEEVNYLLNNFNFQSRKELREYLILEFAIYLGLTASEIVSIKVQDINLEMSYVKVLKSEKERYVSLNKIDKENLKIYMEGIKSAQTLFYNNRNNMLTRQGLWKIIKNTNKDYLLTPQLLKNTYTKNKF